MASPLMAFALLAHSVPPPSQRGWTRRHPDEIKVLVALSRGLSNAEIGAALYMSAATAKADVGRLLTKL